MGFTLSPHFPSKRRPAPKPPAQSPCADLLKLFPCSIYSSISSFRGKATNAHCVWMGSIHFVRETNREARPIPQWDTEDEYCSTAVPSGAHTDCIFNHHVCCLYIQKCTCCYAKCADGLCIIYFYPPRRICSAFMAHTPPVLLWYPAFPCQRTNFGMDRQGECRARSANFCT